MMCPRRFWACNFLLKKSFALALKLSLLAGEIFMSMLLCPVHVHVDCAGSHETGAAAGASGLFAVNFRKKTALPRRLAQKQKFRTDILPIDLSGELVRRSCQETSCGDLVQKSSRETSYRDLANRALLEIMIMYRDLARRPLIEILYRDLVKRAAILLRDLFPRS